MTPVVGVHVLGQHSLWEFDNVYHVAGVGVQSEDYIKASNKIKFDVFQNISRVDYDDWMAVASATFTSTTTSSTTTSSSTTTTTTA